MPGDVPVLVALMRQLSGNEITPTAITGLIAPESGQAVLVAEEGGQVLGVMAMNQSPMLHGPAWPGLGAPATQDKLWSHAESR